MAGIDSARAVFIDLDRTLLRRASGEVLHASLESAGLSRSLPGDGLLYAVYDRLGENLPSMALARAAALLARGWAREEVLEAGRTAVPGLVALVAPYAPGILATYRGAGYRLVLTTTSPIDMIAAFAEALDFDEVIATRYEVRDGRYTGRLSGPFVWGIGKLAAVRRWARAAGVDLAQSHACSDSAFDLPLLSAVGHPHAVNPDPTLTSIATLRRWPVEHWDRPAGVPSWFGLEPYHLLRPWVRPELFPYARFDIEGVDHVPRHGPVLIAANHRSYFDVAALAIVAARLGRPVRFLAKKEVFDAPVVGRLTRAIGGIRVERADGDRAQDALHLAEAALRAGEAVLVLPQGTIPRGTAFFDPVLHARTGTARLAASTGAPVVPVGIWGTERVWPRSARLPEVAALVRPPTVRVRVGRPIVLGLDDAKADTAVVMAAISALLPPEGRVRRQPGPEELARTYPPGCLVE
ncbi:MAG TPA: HAD-IB family hydrolase [Acidimicrobiales bacterium]|nr:HAD-IB family hydrolase [Acidimicrobiales bacterium]